MEGRDKQMKEEIREGRKGPRNIFKNTFKRNECTDRKDGEKTLKKELTNKKMKNKLRNKQTEE